MYIYTDLAHITSVPGIGHACLLFKIDKAELQGRYEKLQLTVTLYSLIHFCVYFNIQSVYMQFLNSTDLIMGVTEVRGHTLIMATHIGPEICLIMS